MPALTLQHPRPASQQRSRDPVRLDAWLRRSATLEIRRLVPGTRRADPPQKAFGRAPHASRSSWSRARHGCPSNPLYRIAVLLHDCRLAGVSRAEADARLVARVAQRHVWLDVVRTELTSGWWRIETVTLPSRRRPHAN